MVRPIVSAGAVWVNVAGLAQQSQTTSLTRAFGIITHAEQVFILSKHHINEAMVKLCKGNMYPI